MVRCTRVVEHLRLRGESESAVRHALPALEDAFRTASLPDAGARLVCVRRLQLGRLPSKGSAQTVALLIEKRFAEAEWRFVHASDSGADFAEAVWFGDVLEAHETAALRVVAGETLDAWFWPLALPAVVKASSGERLRAIAFAIAAMKEAPRALPAWTASLVRAGYRQQLISALRPGDGAPLLQAAGVSLVAPEYAGATAVTSQENRDRRAQVQPMDDRGAFVELMANRADGRTPQRPQPIAERATTRAAAAADNSTTPGTPAQSSGGQPARPQLVASRERVPHHGVDPPGNRTVASDDAKTETVPDESSKEGTQGAVRGLSHERRPASATDVPAGPGAAAATAVAQSDPAGVAESVQATACGSNDQAAADGPLALPSPWQLPCGAPTTAGGLLFLLPVLERVGFAKWAEQRRTGEPEPEVVAAQILHLLLTRLGVEGEDPIWRLAPAFRLKPEATESPTRDLRGFRRQPELAQPTGGFRLQPEGCDVANIWLTTCRRYLRRHVRIGLASLVVRPARVAITPTHLDIFFRLNAVDVRIRRAGLDIDPGWVPWFGRVVGFHYGD